MDLAREGVDCVLLAGQLRDASLVARCVAQFQQVTCASPADLAAPRLLDRHRAVNYVSSAPGQSLPLEFLLDGEVRIVLLRATVSVTGADLYAGAALAGLRAVPAEPPVLRARAGLPSLDR